MRPWTRNQIALTVVLAVVVIFLLGVVFHH
jgi:hypothetical protein